jgi:hypothetical protein
VLSSTFARANRFLSVQWMHQGLKLRRARRIGHFLKVFLKVSSWFQVFLKVSRWFPFHFAAFFARAHLGQETKY